MRFVNVFSHTKTNYVEILIHAAGDLQLASYFSETTPEICDIIVTVSVMNFYCTKAKI